MPDTDFMLNECVFNFRFFRCQHFCQLVGIFGFHWILIVEDFFLGYKMKLKNKNINEEKRTNPLDDVRI